MNNRLLWMLSILFIALVGLRFNVSIIAWVMFVPLLILVRNTKGKNWAWILLLLQILKIITDRSYKLIQT